MFTFLALFLPAGLSEFEFDYFTFIKRTFMYRPFLIFSVLLFIAPRSDAQNAMPNPGFENWTTVGNYQDPDNWNTLNASTAIVGVLTAQKASGADVHSGSYAIKLITKSVFGQTANGLATTGTIDVQNQTITGGIAYTLRPDSISGWYKYTPAGGDNGFINFILLDNANDTIGFGEFTTPVAIVSSYTYFSVPIVYRSAAVPVLARSILSSSAGYISVVNSTMFVDDLQLIFNPTAIDEVSGEMKEELSFEYRNEELLVRTATAGTVKLNVFNTSGQEVFAIEMEGREVTVKLPGLAHGVYLVRLSSSSASHTVNGKISIN